VQDSHGAWSDEMEAEIHVVPSIAPLSLGPVIWDLPSLDKKGTHFFAWNDTSGLNRTLGLFLASLPSKGHLLHGDSIISMPNSIVAQSAWSKGTNLSFQASPEACSEEDLLFTDDSFSLHVVALDADQQVMSISNGTNVTLRISCKIEPIHLGTSHESISVVASSPKLDNPCSGYNFNFSRPVEEFCVNKAALFDVHAYNTKRQPELVLISLATTNGLLTINTNLPEVVFPFGDQPVMRSSIHILLPADRLDETLAAVHFQSRIPGEDEIHVVVQSGYCSHKERLFLDQDELMTGPECIQTELIIPVDVQVSLADSDQYLYQEFPWIPLPFAFCMLLFIKLRGKSREILLQDEGATCNLTSVDSKEEVKWKEYEDPKTGQKYYHNSEDGEVTWSPPFNEECILCSK
jgi:WW domain